MNHTQLTSPDCTRWTTGMGLVGQGFKLFSLGPPKVSIGKQDAIGVPQGSSETNNNPRAQGTACNSPLQAAPHGPTGMSRGSRMTHMGMVFQASKLVNFGTSSDFFREA
jgi:hypothetical protein